MQRKNRRPSWRYEEATNGADISMVTALDEIAWLLNIRGSDIAYNPVAIAFVVVTMKETIICTNVDQVRGDVEEHFARESIHVGLMKNSVRCY